MKNEIDIKDIGPIEEFRYAMDGPGLHIITGHHGAGKTTILRTVELATNGRTDGKLTKRDDTSRGEATIAGKTIRIAKTVREEGELTVDGLGDLDLANLHSPKFVDAATRDKHRIKTLVRLAGVAANPSLFHKLVGGREQFEAIIPPESVMTDDLVEMTARVKRSIEKEAQRREDQERTALSNMQSQTTIASSVDLALPSDEQQLKESHTLAVELRSRLKQQRTTALEIVEKAAKAREQLKAAQTGPTVAQMQAALDGASVARTAAGEKVESLKQQLAAAQSELMIAIDREESARRAVASANREAEMFAAWSADIEAAEKITCPTEQQIAEADLAVDRAASAIETGVAVRAAHRAQQQAAGYAEEAKQHSKDASRLRGAAQDTQDVLSEAVSRITGCPLRVKINDAGDPRLVMQTDRSEHEPFDDMSDGERWPVIIKMAAERNRLIVLSQAAFGELSPESRSQLHALAVEHGCYVLTAQVTDGPLEARMYAQELAAAAA